MSKYLKPKQHYIDLYDRVTVEDCRWRENFHKNHKLPKKIIKKHSEKDIGHVSRVAFELDLLFTTGERYLKKEETVQEWMERDEERDRRLENAEAPYAECLSCGSVLSPIHKDLHDWGHDKEERVLFMYECPKGCLPRRAFFDDGEEWQRTSHPCPKCGTELESEDTKKKTKIVMREFCSSCNYESEDEMSLTPKKEKQDFDFEKDRKRFCLDEKRGQEYVKTKHQFEQMKEFMDEWKHKEKNKDLYDKVAKIKKLTVVQLGKLLSPALEKEGYIHFSLKEPEIDKNVKVEFTVQESKGDREEYDSKMVLKKKIDSLLADTNWRLMSDGISYRIGILTGRLRAYEREEDLLKLVKDRK